MPDYNTYQLLNSLTDTASKGSGDKVWAILAPIIAIVGAILLYFLFVRPQNEPQNPTLRSLKNFLSFKTMKIEALVKMFYYGSTILVILSSFSMLQFVQYDDTYIFQFFGQLILGPIAIRLVYELIMIFIKIWHNTEKK